MEEKQEKMSWRFSFCEIEIFKVDLPFETFDGWKPSAGEKKFFF